ncbi:MAG: lysine 2,3-aminomutase [bacterium]|nr:lysine 2,3-aminomutase [bacterium]
METESTKLGLRIRELFNVDERLWNDWRWQLKNRITRLEELERILNLTEQEAIDIERSLEHLKMAITPYYLSLIDPSNYNDPIRLQSIPSIHELAHMPYETEDPLKEEIYSPLPGLVHRYPDRVLLIVTDSCPTLCRHCTRRRLTEKIKSNNNHIELNKAFEYICSHREIRDVIISGGDPLILPDQMIERIISRLRDIDHVEIIRIGTRVPVTLPQRVTPELCSMLQKYHPIWVNTHFNHPNEITVESSKACEMLANAGIPLGNQSVLLKGINDNVEVMKKLVQGLLKIRIRPYYLYQCDMVEGLSHFRTSIEKGIEIIEALQGFTSGLAVPTFVIDAPGMGKIPISPQYIIGRNGDQILLRNFEGKISAYTNPS